MRLWHSFTPFGKSKNVYQSWRHKIINIDKLKWLSSVSAGRPAKPSSFANNILQHLSLFLEKLGWKQEAQGKHVCRAQQHSKVQCNWDSIWNLCDWTEGVIFTCDSIWHCLNLIRPWPLKCTKLFLKMPL